MDTRNKICVLDTTVLVEDPEIMYKLGDVTVVIPLAVLKELDGLKSSEKLLVAEAARVVGRMLDNFSSYANLTEGVKLSSGGTLVVYKGYEPLSALASEADNKVVGAALRLKTEGKEVVLYTTDANMRTVARVYAVSAEIPGFMSSQFSEGDLGPEGRKADSGASLDEKEKIALKRVKAYLAGLAFVSAVFGIAMGADSEGKLGLLLGFAFFGGGLFITAGLVGSLIIALLSGARPRTSRDPRIEGTFENFETDHFLNPKYDFLASNVMYDPSEDRK